MQWIIEHCGPINEFGDTQALRLVDALRMLGRDHTEVKMVPFENTLIGLENTDPQSPAFFYCSTAMAEKVALEGYYRPGAYWGAGWFDPLSWKGKRSDLLNENAHALTVAELRRDWVTKSSFVKSVGVKELIGMVLWPDKSDKDTWILEHKDLDGDVELVISPTIKIEREWRFFVVDGTVITGSTYRKDGYRSVRHPVSAAAWAAAETAVREWMPNDTIVIDIARTWDGEYKVVEFNCINSSGLYHCDAMRLVEAMEAKIGSASN